ncbi:Non-specific lipid-transfer protein [Thalictrum thalictroides]|uniref:Non-specific lipid-transfer protein n=1 Tax=Thalictrum thalictroides TaxID=46969 RepID=A0A7J6XDE7_THATH|nr:Non-specific lipid-transfer protein [Thalictrum thalictroides]
MANTVVLKLVCALVVCIVVTATHVEAEVTCNEVKNDLGTCLSYLQSGGDVPETCCEGMNSLYAAANDTPARQTACRCIKQFASSVSGINEDNANSLPGKCGYSETALPAQLCATPVLFI